MSQKGNRLDEVLASLLDRRLSRNQLRSLTTVPDGMVDFSSNAYLSLSSQPAVQQSFLARLHTTAANATATNPGLLGSGGSRLLDGNSSHAESLECNIADFHRAQAGLLFNSAMDANVGLFSCVPQPGDAIVYDELIHASVHDGMRLSRASQRIPFAHSCVWQEHGSSTATTGTKCLEAVLQSLLQGPDGSLCRSGERNVFIAVEGIYSMDGDLAPLAEIVDCVERYLPRGNGYIIVDEAHSTGVLGDRGRGLVCELGLEDRVWARVLGFGKAIGCTGGIVLCSSTTRAYLINYARTLIYTTAMAFPTLASIEVAYNFITAGLAEPLLKSLRFLVQETHRLLLALCASNSAPADLLRVNTESPKSPIIPIFTSQPRNLARYCQARGFMVRPIVAPTVPKGRERVRLCLHAGNTIAEVAGLVEAVGAWLAAWRAETISREETIGREARVEARQSSAPGIAGTAKSKI
ncbi:pyridoxal phosphate-dependent transferase [Chaetomidium leptoderma]|uniref:Pyridoxal phosphate-dependent transferase n=1 Tax=Chaetomidium leptoderma TaxID=669021 RepID=A0AAN6ZYD2_9PEZI|nr:pyridoxal phosphate-dependent transferase [Chaetomidium leptoderma]